VRRHRRVRSKLTIVSKDRARKVTRSTRFVTVRKS
jgi:hypothetical protein